MSKRSERRAQLFEDLDLARLEMIELVRGRIARSDELEDVELATEIVEAILLDRPDLMQRLVYPPSRRIWYSRRESLHLPATPWLMRAGDEYGNDTLAVRVPLAGQLVVVTNRRLRRFVEPLNRMLADSDG